MKRFFCTVLLAFAMPSIAAEHLILVGGGSYPATALSRFVEWAGKEQSRILVVSWGGPLAGPALQRFSAALAPFHPAQIAAAPTLQEMPLRRAEFIRQLESASGVFFTGGKQLNIMKVIHEAGLEEVLRKRYEAGVVFGGSSAGTEIMPEVMITGQGDFDVIDPTKVATSDGLGLLSGVFVDMHFLRRRRENRLFSLLLQGKTSLGIGVDQDSAIAIENGHAAQVVGPGEAMLVVRGRQPNHFLVRLIQTGETFDLGHPDAD